MSSRRRNVRVLVATISALAISGGLCGQERPPDRGRVAEPRAARAGAPDRARPGGRAGGAAYSQRTASRRPQQSLFLPNMSVFDGDGDGSLSREEFERAAKELFEVYDTNADGKLEEGEMRQSQGAIWLEPSARARQILLLFDLNNDARIAAEECLLPPAKFKELDQDKTGALENDDLVKLSLSQAALLLIPERRSALVLAVYDQNKDGRLTADEIKLETSVLRVADKNADGILDAEEVKTLPPLPPDHPRRQAQEMIARYDEDGDKMLSENEFRRTRAPFDMVDDNKDGLVELKELTAWFESGRGRGTRVYAVSRMVQNVMGRYDKNNDGKITKDEQLNMPETLWARWDLNADGTIDTKEIEDSVLNPRRINPQPAGVAPGGGRDATGEPRGALIRQNAAEIVKARDRDKNGKLNAEEMGLDPRVFERMDADGDGQLTAEEIAAGQGAGWARYDEARRRATEMRERGIRKRPDN